MLLRAGDPRRALDRFAAVLTHDPKSGEALAGAGEAAFELADYPQARRYLTAAPSSLGRVEELRTIVNLVLTTDPLAPRLSLQERRRRLGLHLTAAASELAQCVAGPQGGGPSSPALRALGAEVDALVAALDTRRGPRTREAIEEGFDLAHRGARAVVDECGAATPADRATLLIARRYGLDGS
jgi:hypothetical protein